MHTYENASIWDRARVLKRLIRVFAEGGDATKVLRMAPMQTGHGCAQMHQ